MEEDENLKEEKDKKPESVNETYNFVYEKDKEKLKLDLKLKNSQMELIIGRENTIPSTYYQEKFSLENLQKIAKYIRQFDTLTEVYNDFKRNLEQNKYEINLKDIEEKINIKIKPDSFNSEFNLEIPLEKMDQEKMLKDLCATIRTHDDIIKEIQNVREPELKNGKKLEELEKEIQKLKQDISDLKAKEYKEDVLFADSTIIENNFERKLLQSFIKEVDTSKKYIYPVLIYKATVDGDNSQAFHDKCDYKGATLTIVKSKKGRRFGGYSSISWDRNIGSYSNNGVSFLFSLDTRTYYKNSSGYYTYHDNNYGPCFGYTNSSGYYDLSISNGCLNNQNSQSYKTYYQMNSTYELTAESSYNFQVEDYEVFQI